MFLGTFLLSLHQRKTYSSHHAKTTQHLQRLRSYLRKSSLSVAPTGTQLCASNVALQLFSNANQLAIQRGRQRGCDWEGGARPHPEKTSGGGSRDAVLLYFEVGFSVEKALLTFLRQFGPNYVDRRDLEEIRELLWREQQLWPVLP